MTEPLEPSRPWRVFSMALAIFIVAGGLVWLSREDGPPPYQAAKHEKRETPKPPPREPATRRERAPAPEPMDATARAARLNALPPLPLPQTPLAEQLAVLSDRARAGDPVAGCRLVLAGARCRQQAWGREFSGQAQRSMERGAQRLESTLVDLVAREREAAADGFCDDVGLRDLPSANAVLQRAQPWMTPRQKVLVALMRADGSIERLDPGVIGTTEPGGYQYPQFLAEHAYEFLLEGFRAYDPLALEGLALIHAPSGALGRRSTGPSLPNPRLYAFYVGLLERLYGPESVGEPAQRGAATARATLPPESRERLDRQIDTEARQWLEAESPGTVAEKWQALQREDLDLGACEP